MRQATLASAEAPLQAWRVGVVIGVTTPTPGDAPMQGGRVRVDDAAVRRHAGACVRGRGVRVVIGEDEALLRQGVVRLLQDAGFEVVAEAADAHGAVCGPPRMIGDRKVDRTRPFGRPSASRRAPRAGVPSADCDQDETAQG
jgi:hypothetical protein